MTNTPPMVDRQRSGRKISVFVPGNSNSGEIEREFARTVRETLGPERAALFLDEARQAQRHFDSLSGEERIVTLIPKDEKSGEIIVTQRNGTSFNYYEHSWDDRMGFEYGHLLAVFLPEFSLNP